MGREQNDDARAGEVRRQDIKFGRTLGSLLHRPSFGSSRNLSSSTNVVTIKLQNIPTPKNPMPNLWALKISQKDCIFFGRDTRKLPLGHYHESSNCIEYFNQATHTKKYLPNFPTSPPPHQKKKKKKKKKNRNRKFQTPKNPSIIPVTWNPGEKTTREGWESYCQE